MLRIEALAVTAGSFQLRDVDLSLAKGDCHVVVGPSGAGKSTLLNAILGVLPIQQGRIFIGEVEVSGLPIEQRGLGYVPQHLSLFPHMTVRDNLDYSARARGIRPAEFGPVVEELAAMTGIGALLDRRPSTLSGGERQRVGLVRALASRPKLMLLDEPFGALNETLRREHWRMLRDLQKAWGLTVLMVTHDLTEAFHLGDRLSILLEGRQVQLGDPDTIYRRPASAEIARFLGIENLFPARPVGQDGDHIWLDVGSARLLAPSVPHSQGAHWVAFRGEDVALARPESAAGKINALAARVTEIRLGSPFVGVRLDAGFPLVASLTRRQHDDLRLHVGASVTAAIRPSDIHVLPDSSGPENGAPRDCPLKDERSSNSVR